MLAIIYIAFISLGLPDSLLGSAWPVMYEQLNVPISYAGIVTMIITGGTVVSSIMTDKLTRKLGTGLTAAISVLMTAAALYGFSISGSFILLCIWAVPYGLGAGAIDAALNNFVALHYSSRHMNWLHCFWGVGAAVSPYIMSYHLTGGFGWNSGYRSVAFIQIALTTALFISLPIWRRASFAGNSREIALDNTSGYNDQNAKPALSLRQVLNIKGTKLIFLTMFAYCALENTTGLWASSYLAKFRGIAPETAAEFASLFYLGITFGRFICGFIADRIGDRLLFRYGLIIIIFGITLVGIPMSSSTTALIGLVIIGLGCAPVFPSVIHATPSNFGHANSQAIIGLQMASAYTGSALMPPLFGWIAGSISIGLYPAFLLIFAVSVLFMSERFNKTIIGTQNI